MKFSVVVCPYCEKPLAIIKPIEGKPRPMAYPHLLIMANLAGIPAFLVFYEISSNPNPAFLDMAFPDGSPIMDIDRFVIQQLPDGEVLDFRPQEYVLWLAKIQYGCACGQGREHLRQLEGPKTCKVNLNWPQGVLDTMQEVFDAAEKDSVVRETVNVWMEGRNGSALVAVNMRERSTEGDYEADVQVSKRFRDFLDTIQTAISARETPDNE